MVVMYQKVVRYQLDWWYHSNTQRITHLMHRATDESARTDNQGHRRVLGHLFKLSYLRGRPMTKDTDRCLVTYSNCTIYMVNQQPRILKGAWSLIRTILLMGWTDDQGHWQLPGHLFQLSTITIDECLGHLFLFSYPQGGLTTKDTSAWSLIRTVLRTGWTDDQGHRWVHGHLFKLFYLLGGPTTKDTDRCLVTYSNCPTYGVDRRPRILMGA